MNIYPQFNKFQCRKDKEQLLRQRSITLWFTGLSGSGKSTIAAALEQMLTEHGFLCYILDGDSLRSGINSDLGFSDTERKENIRRIAEVAKLFNRAGVITIVSAITPTEELRATARNVLCKDDIVEIYLSTPLAECERRDVKGLYAKARAGSISHFTGISAPFEPPQHTDIEIDTSTTTLKDCVDTIFQTISNRICYEL